MTLDSEAVCKTVQILIRWLPQELAGPDLHHFPRWIYVTSAGQRLMCHKHTGQGAIENVNTIKEHR